MPNEMVVLEFKAVSPLFEMCRDGTKYWDARLVDPEDERFHKLAVWNLAGRNYLLAVKFYNPATGLSFTREVLYLDNIRYVSSDVIGLAQQHPYAEKAPPGGLWVMMYLGQRIE